MKFVEENSPRWGVGLAEGRPGKRVGCRTWGSAFPKTERVDKRGGCAFRADSVNGSKLDALIFG